jgi:hypothetical protein
MIVVFHATNCRRDANAGGYTCDHTSIDVHVAQDRVKWRVGESAESLFDDRMFTIMRFYFVDDFRAPSIFRNERSIRPSK